MEQSLWWSFNKLSPQQGVLYDVQLALERLQLVVELQALHHGHVVQLRVRVAAEASAQSRELLEAVGAVFQ